MKFQFFINTLNFEIMHFDLFFINKHTLGTCIYIETCLFINVWLVFLQSELFRRQFENNTVNFRIKFIYSLRLRPELESEIQMRHQLAVKTYTMVPSRYLFTFHITKHTLLISKSEIQVLRLIDITHRLRNLASNNRAEHLQTLLSRSFNYCKEMKFCFYFQCKFVDYVSLFILRNPYLWKSYCFRIFIRNYCKLCWVIIFKYNFLNISSYSFSIVNKWTVL